MTFYTARQLDVATEEPELAVHTSVLPVRRRRRRRRGGRSKGGRRGRSDQELKTQPASRRSLNAIETASGDSFTEIGAVDRRAGMQPAADRIPVDATRCRCDPLAYSAHVCQIRLKLPPKLAGEIAMLPQNRCTELSGTHLHSQTQANLTCSIRGPARALADPSACSAHACQIRP